MVGGSGEGGGLGAYFATGSEVRCVKKRVGVVGYGCGAMVAEVAGVEVAEKVPRRSKARVIISNIILGGKGEEV